MAPVLDILSYVFWVIIAIMILVFVHEMGHFLTAKLFKMRVERFSIGFPPKIIGKTFGETEYVIGATPLGGYVKISGMVDESLDAENLASEPQPWEFRAKPVWQKMIVITAGVVFNIILAFVIFTSLKLGYGETYVPAENIEAVYVAAGTPAYDMGLRTGDRLIAVAGKPLEKYDDIQSLEALAVDPFSVTAVRGQDTLQLTAGDDFMTKLNRAQGVLGISAAPSLIGGVVGNAPAAATGLQAGDRIVALDGKPVRFWAELTDRIQETKGRPVQIVWARPDSLIASGTKATPDTASRIAAPPKTKLFTARVQARKDDASGRYMLGISAPDEAMILKEFGVRSKEYGVGEAISEGASDVWIHTSAIVGSLKKIVSGRENVRENVGGPIMIAKVTRQAAEAGARVFWNIVAMLSITLAVMNILPIPALDGGHLVFLIYEAIARKEPSLKIRMALQQVGMVLLLALMAFLIFNDLLRL